MKIIATTKENENVKREQFTPDLLKEETRTVWELYKQRIIRDIYFRADRKDAVIIMECGDVDEAKKFLDTLPLVREKLISFDIIPLRPYDGFEILFEQK
ncbi:MAG: superoxide dismutase [Bacteroidota bacterium]